ncbi:MAG: hypothetical protein EBR82_01315 [Caulobacteraceae bacterium]|nr:hypothetical protein [Caulobacteraceae bacterium]
MGRRIGMSAMAGAVCLFASALPVVSAAQDYPNPTEAEIRAAIGEARGQIADMAAFYGWTGVVEITTGGGLETTRSGVSLNDDRIIEMVGGLKAFQVHDAVGLLVAHEVWHYVELQRDDISLPIPDQDRRRLYECHADLMAGRYLAKDESAAGYAGGFGHPFAYYTATNLWRRDIVGSPDYPTADQRALAVRFGALGAIVDHAIALGTPESVAAVSTEIDKRSGESLDVWRERTCQGVTRFRSVVAASVDVTARPGRRLGADVVFDLEYQNRSDRPATVTVLLRATPSYLSAQALGREGAVWVFPRTFRIAAQSVTPLSVTINDWPGPADEVYLDYRKDDGTSLFQGDLIKEPTDRSQFALATGLSPEDLALGLAIQRLANDAPNAFGLHRGRGSSIVSDSLVVPSTVPVPGASRTMIWINDDGSSHLDAEFYLASALPAAGADPDPGARLQEAEQLYARYVSALRRIWPAARWKTDTETSYRNEEVTKIWVTRYSRVEIGIIRGDYPGVTFTIRPSLLARSTGV